MATKPLDFLNRLPSVSELLDKQPVRALSDRWNRSVVAAGVRSFLDELRSDLQRRAADVPTIRELAERAARYVVSQQQSSQRTVINATGRLFGAPWSSVPLADSALERAVLVGRHFVSTPARDGRWPAMSADVEPLFCRLTGAGAAVAVHSYPGALWLALSALAADREVLVSRAEVGEVDSAGPLPKLAAAARAILKDVGTANRTVAADYETAVSPRAAVLLKLHSDEFRIVGETASTELEELVALARDREVILVVAMGAAPLADPPAGFAWPRPTVKACVAAGVDLVIVRGEGLVGGPPCGVIAGREDIVRRIAAQPLFAAWQLDPFRAAALARTLHCYDDSPNGAQSLPVWQLLTTPVENLRNRAERIAPQAAQAPAIASAVAVETRSLLAPASPFDGGWPSYAVALTPADGNVEALRERLANASPSVLGRVEGTCLVLDLRTVFPNQDRALVEAICGGPLTDRDMSSANGGEPATDPAANV